jgi:choice-of-anchor B domain-containing protein
MLSIVTLCGMSISSYNLKADELEPYLGPFPDSENMEFLSQLTPDQMGVTSPAIRDTLRLSDIWGWESPNGEEYALTGTIDGLSIVRVTHPEIPEFIGIVPTSNPLSSGNLWRDIGVFNLYEPGLDHFTGYAYVTTEDVVNGMIILELNGLDDMGAAPDAAFQIPPSAVWRKGGYESAHNVYVNNESGFAYLAGVHLEDGDNACGDVDPAPRFNTLVLDVRSNPLDPEVVACVPNRGEHDIYVVNYTGRDKDYKGSEIAYVFDGRERDPVTTGTCRYWITPEDCLGTGGKTEIWDVTDKDNIQVISSFNVPNLCFSHQGWTTRKEEFLIIDDELDEVGSGQCRNNLVFDHPGLYIVDIRDLDNPVFQERFSIDRAFGNDHNIYRLGDKLYWAAYSAGASVLNLETEGEQDNLSLNLEEIAYMDTEPRNPAGGFFQGLWGIFAFSQSGTIVGSDISNGLVIMRVEEMDGLRKSGKGPRKPKE